MFTPFKNEPYVNFSEPENQQLMKEAIAKVRSERFGKSFPLYIDGKQVTTNKNFESVNPNKKSEVVGTFAAAGKSEVDDAIESATRNFEWWSRRPVEERALILVRAAAILRRRRFEMDAMMVLEAGKSYLEADADTAEAIDFLEFYARQALRLDGDQGTTPFDGESNVMLYRSLGPVAVIAPWNFPCAILLGMTTAAVVTGNTVNLKPAEQTPGIAHFCYEILEEAGLPGGVINMLTGFGEEAGQPLVESPKTRMICFTGSREVGLKINELAAKHRPGQKWIKRVIAEMGGKDTIIVDSTADIDAAVDGVVKSAFGFSGQKCSACSRAIIHQDVYDEFCEKLKTATDALVFGPTEDHGNNLGAVSSDEAFEKATQYIEIGKNEGQLLCGGEYDDSEAYNVHPTVFKDVDISARIAQEEIFAPVLALVKGTDFDDCLEKANSGEYGLTGAVFSRTAEHLTKARRDFFVGNMYINRKCTGALVDVQPFGGFNMSGTDSKAGGRDYLLLFLQGQSIAEKF